MRQPKAGGEEFIVHRLHHPSLMGGPKRNRTRRFLILPRCACFCVCVREQERGFAISDPHTQRCIKKPVSTPLRCAFAYGRVRISLPPAPGSARVVLHKVPARLRLLPRIFKAFVTKRRVALRRQARGDYTKRRICSLSPVYSPCTGL